MMRQEARIFNLTGTTMMLYLRTDGDEPAPYTPGQLFSAGEDPTDPSDYARLYVKGRFKETDDQTFGPAGHQNAVTGIITIPMLYKSILAKAEYVDPYLNGSRFVRVGAIVDEGRIFITQRIMSIYNKDTADIVYKGNNV
jgi:hypothetical protein